MRLGEFTKGYAPVKLASPATRQDR